MTKSIHGHEVLRKVIDSGKTYTQESLLCSIRDWFGDQARFHTCSSRELTAEELISFLTDRGKLRVVDSGLRVDEGKICSDV